MFVLIGDIRESRKLVQKRRAKIQTDLQTLFESLAHRHRADMLSPLQLTLGDEFQAVFKDGASAWAVIQQMGRDTHRWGISFRFALVCDELYTPINKKEPLRMDGPAFWKARELIEAKQRRYSFFVQRSRFNSTLSVLGEVLEDIEDGWKKVHPEYIHYALEHPDRTIVEMAKTFKKAQTTLSRSLKSARYKLYQRVTQELLRFLKENPA